MAVQELALPQVELLVAQSWLRQSPLLRDAGSGRCGLGGSVLPFGGGHAAPKPSQRGSWCTSPTRLRHTHHKVAVIDNRTVITGIFHKSPNATHQNDETLLVIHSPQLTEHFTAEMNLLWQEAELGITPRLERKLQQQRRICVSGSQRGRGLARRLGEDVRNEVYNLTNQGYKESINCL